MSLIPEIKLRDLQKLSPKEVQDMKSSIITDGEGNYLGTLLVPQTDFIKMQAEFMGELSNGVKPRE